MGTRSHKAVIFGGLSSNTYLTGGDTNDFANNVDHSGFAWAKLPNTGDQALVSKRAAAGNQEGYELRFISGVLELLLTGTDGTAMRVSAGTADQWLDGTFHMFAWTWEGTVGNDATNATLYVDGVAQSLTTVTDTLAATTANTGNFQVSGAAGATRVLDEAVVDFVAIYDDLLTAGEITSLYNNGDPADPRITLPGNLVAFYPMGDLSAYPTLRNMIHDGTLEDAVITDFSRSKHVTSATGVNVGDIDPANPGGICKSSLSPNVGGEHFEYNDSVLSDTIQEFKPGTPFTVSIWAKSDQLSFVSAYIGKVDASLDRGWYVGQNSNGGGGELFMNMYDALTGGGGNASVLAGSSSDHDNTWRHYAFVYDGSVPITNTSMVAYRNGVDVSVAGANTFPVGGTFRNTLEPFRVGARGGGGMQNDTYLCEPQIIARAWTAAEALAEYNGGVPRHPDVLGDDDIVYYAQMGENYLELTMTNMQRGDIINDPVGGPPTGGTADSTSPTVDNFSPANGTALTETQPFFFDVKDNLSAFAGVFVYVDPGNGRPEAVYDLAADEFIGTYDQLSSVVNIADGLQFEVRRFEGWVGNVTATIRVVDGSGNVNS